jgi:hypothetical protein
MGRISFLGWDTEERGEGRRLDADFHDSHDLELLVDGLGRMVAGG